MGTSGGGGGAHRVDERDVGDLLVVGHLRPLLGVDDGAHDLGPRHQVDRLLGHRHQVGPAPRGGRA